MVRGWQVRIVGEMAPACQPQRQGDAHRERDEDKGDDSQNPTGGSVRGRNRGDEALGLSSRPLRPCAVMESGLTALRGL